MNKTERYLWIAGLVLAGFVIHGQSNNNANLHTNNANLQTLLATYDAETHIQNAQISDFNTQLSVIREESYSQGFEAGKTQAGIALVKGGSLYDYADGYHAAIAQNIEESDVLEISAEIFNELKSLRKMVPRLLNQNEELQAKLASRTDSGYALDLLIENLEAEEDADATYLEIIDLLMETEVPPTISFESPSAVIAKEEE